MIYKSLRLIERANLQKPFGETSPDRSDYPRLEKWKSQPPFDEHPDWFSQRLQRDGIDERQLLALFSEPGDTSGVGGWEIELSEIYKLYRGQSLSDRVLTILKASDPNFGFVNLVIPILCHFQVGVVEILARAGQKTGGEFFLGTLVDELIANLAQRLVSRLSRTLILEINISRIRGELKGQTPEQRFDYFCQELLSEKTFQSFLSEYPVLFRQLKTIATNRLNFLELFFGHLAADWPELWQDFFPGSPPEALAHLTFDGDSHRGGRSVAVITFASGKRIVYKPRSLRIDIHFYALLDWLNQKGSGSVFRLVKSLDRGSHAWVECVEKHDCQSEDEVRRFFQRVGGLLAVLRVLCGSDFHYQNVIASGEQPVLIDLECLFQPYLKEYGTGSAEHIAQKIILDSVLSVGLLPQRTWIDSPSQSVDLSALGARSKQLALHSHPVIENPGTDRVQLVRRRLEMGGNTEQAQPGLIGKQIDILEYRSSILAGFSKVYGILLENRVELGSPGGLLAAFAGEEIRIVPRDTSTYLSLLLESYHPDVLRDALDRDQLFDGLWVSREDFEKEPGSLIRAEQYDLWRDDIPFFSTRTDSRDLVCGDGYVIKDYFGTAGLELVFQCLNALSPADLRRQLGFIEAAMTALVSFELDSLSSSRLPEPPSHWEQQSRHLLRYKSSDLKIELISEAKKIGDRLVEMAILGRQDVTWVNNILAGDYNATSITGLDLYDGLPGMALFLAHLGLQAGDEKYTDLAKRIVFSIQNQLGNKPDSAQNLGVFSGIGGLIYMFGHLARLWSDDNLIGDAQKVVRILLPILEKNDIPDVVAGHAGLISAGLSLHRLTGDPCALELAVKCGELLAGTAVPQVFGLAWNMPKAEKNIALTGFGHGTAGIAWALLKLADATSRSDFRALALGGLEYERSHFSTEQGNWKDLRPFVRPVNRITSFDNFNFMTAWCHGAAGIGLARLDTLEFGDAHFGQELQVALHTTRLTLFDRFNHSLCHGDLGNIDLLLSASRKLKDRRLNDTVNTAAAMILADIKRNGWRTGIPMNIESFGLMVGISGIGYELLRLANPEVVPSVLILEMP